MGRRRNRETYTQDTFLGLDTRTSEILIQPQMGRACQNMKFSQVGLFQKCGGYAQLFPNYAITNNVVWMNKIYHGPAVGGVLQEKLLIVDSAGNLQVLVPGTGWVTLMAGLSPIPMQCAVLSNLAGTNVDKVYLVNGADLMIEYNPGTGVAAFLAGAPQVSMLVVFQQHLWAAGNSDFPNRLYVSELNDGATWDVMKAVDIGSSETYGDVIVGLQHYGDQIVVLKQRGIYEVYNRISTYLNVQTRKRDTSVGPYGQRASASLPDGVYFAVPNDGVYRYADGAVDLVSKAIDDDDFKVAYNLKDVAHPPVMTQTREGLMLSVWNRLTSTRNVAFWDSQVGQWGVIVGPQCNAFAVDNDGTVLFSMDGYKGIYQFSDTRTDFEGTAVECFFTTKDSGLTGPSREKIFREFSVELSPVGQPVYIDWWIDGAVDPASGMCGTFVHQPEGGAPRWNQVNWNAFSWSAGIDTEDTPITWAFPPGARGSNFKFRVRANLQEAFKVRRVILEFQTKGGAMRRGARWA